MAQKTADIVTGSVERTERSFRQDAENAMGSDPVRAIVELITNSDDQYVRVADRRKGSIRVEVQRRRNVPSLILVKDRAGGMTRQAMLERLGKEGTRSSGFEADDDVRGLLGRGAKDCAAFGKVTWRSATPNEDAVFELEPNGTYRATTQDAHNSRRDCGTEVTLEVEQRFTIKTHQNLLNALTRHFQLRPLLSDKNREMTLVDLGHREDRVIYAPPKADQVAISRIPVLGYRDEWIDIDLWKSAENLDDGLDREYWRHGLLVTSGRAAYEVFGGRFEREPWSQYLGWLFGSAEIPGIRRLIKEYDDYLEQGNRPPPANAIRLVARDRRGLVGDSDHPFAAAVHKTLEQFLDPYIQQIRDEREAASSRAALSEDTRRRLRELGQVIGKILEDEEEERPGGKGSEVPVGLTLIPDSQEVEPGRSASVNVRFRPASDEGSVPFAEIQVLAGDATVNSPIFPLVNRGVYYSKNFTIQPMPEGELAELRVVVGAYSETCLVQCQRRLRPPVTTIQFEHASYRVKDNGQRRVALMAPWDMVAADENQDVRVRLEGDPTISIRSRADHFAYDYDRGCGTWDVSIGGRGVGSRARLIAILGDQQAVAEITVSALGSGGVSIELTDEGYPQRAIWEGNVLKISARDRSIARYLGPASKGWPGQNDLHCRAVMAEIAAFHTARRIIERRREPRAAIDVYREHLQLEQRLLPRVHGVLIGAAEVRIARQSGP